MKLDNGSRLLMIGDSITDADRNYAAGPGDPLYLGRGYVAFVHALMNAVHPRSHISILNKGISGNTVRDLAGRWDGDVVAERPDWLSIMIGINDVWRQFDCPDQPELSVLPDAYERTLDELLATPGLDLRGLILMTPFFLEPDRSNPMRQRMDEYGAIVRRLAERRGAILVDTQRAFDSYLDVQPSSTLATDRVHPNPVGHMILARAFLAGVGFEIAG